LIKVKEFSYPLVEFSTSSIEIFDLRIKNFLPMVIFDNHSC